jgi:hypothetical protein
MRALVVVAAAFCPDYETLRDASMEDFTMQDLSGSWYIVATTEPTIPPFCRPCSHADFHVFDSAYRYTIIAQCDVGGVGVNFSIPLGGRIGPAGAEGKCEENWAPFNHTWAPSLVPNMWFNFSREDGWYMSYACIGDILGKDLHAFYLGSRTKRSKEWIEERLHWANASGLVDIAGVTMADDKAYATCGWEETQKEQAFLTTTNEQVV